jgi:hypothetical protein
MSICRSSVHRVQINLHGVSSSIPINQDYRYVIRSTLASGLKNVAQIFEQNKDEYYRRVLSGVGNYTSGVDFKHYDDPRCKCILCWTFRNGFEFNYPTVKAKLLCVMDLLKNENIQRNMRYEVFENLVYENVSGIRSDMIEFMWNSIFKGRTRRDTKKSFDMDPMDPDIQSMLSDFDILQLHKMDESGRMYPVALQNSINELQTRINKEYDSEKRAREICNMTTAEITRAHRDFLLDRLRLYQQVVDEKPLEALWIQLFRHDYIKKNLSKSRVEKTDYAGFEGISRADKSSILSVKISEFEANISSSMKDFYLLDSLERFKVRTAYEQFNNEFSVFLTATETKNFDALSKSVKISNQISREYMSTRVGYMLVYLKQISLKLVQDTNEWWTPILKKNLDLIDKENAIHQFGFQAKLPTRINCTVAVRDYIDGIWQSIRDGQMEYTNSMGQKIEPDGFNELRLKLYGERIREYEQQYVDNKLVQYYLRLPAESRRRVDKKMINHILQLVIEFIQNNNLMSYYNKEDTRKSYKLMSKYDTVADTVQGYLDEEYRGEGGYEEQQQLKFYIQEFSMRIRVDEYVKNKIDNVNRTLDPELTNYALRVVVHFMKTHDLKTWYSGNGSDEERLSFYLEEFSAKMTTNDYVSTRMRRVKLAPKSELSDRKLIHFMFRSVVGFMHENNLLTNFNSQTTRKKFEKERNYEGTTKLPELEAEYYEPGGYEEHEKLIFYIYEFSLREYTKKYVDDKLDGKPHTRMNDMIDYMLRIVIDFMRVNDMMTKYREKNTKKQFMIENNFGPVSSAGPTARQLKLAGMYKEEKKWERLDFYIEEFAEKRSLWDRFSQKLGTRAMWDRFSKNIRKMWNAFSQSRNIPELWRVVLWYKMREKNRLLWQWAKEEYDQHTKLEMTELGQKYVQEVQKTNLADKITAELYLMFDIFNQWRVDTEVLDNFISRNLPPKERFTFVPEMNALKKLPSGYQVEARKDNIREAYKKIIFDKEILKRAVLLRLKKRNDRIREAWDEDVLNGSRTWGLTDLQMSLKKEYNRYRADGVIDQFPFDRDWVDFKYRNIFKWLSVNAKVFVLCKFADVAELSEIEEGSKNGEIVESKYGDAFRDFKRDVPTEWSDSNRKTEDLLVAWVENIGNENVTLRLEKSLQIRKLLQVQNLDVIRVDRNYIYDTVLDYNIIRDRKNEQQRKEQERANELKRLRELNRQRRDLIRSITVDEATEEEKAREALDRAAKDALLMFDDSKSTDRRRIFNEWMMPIREVSESLSDIERSQIINPMVRFRVSECNQPGGRVKFEMFKGGRNEWLTETGIGRKLQYNERIPHDDMRTKREQMDFKWSLEIINKVENNRRRRQASSITNEYMKFMYVYPRKGITDADIKLMILEKIDGKTPDEKNNYLTEYRGQIGDAIKREDKRLKREESEDLARMNIPGAVLDFSKPSRLAIRQRRDKILAIIDSVIQDVTQVEEDDRLQGLSPEEKKYRMSGKLSEDADLQLKTPKWYYTQEMVTSEVERSLKPLDMTVFNKLVGYVTETTKVPYLVRKRSRDFDETEYQRDFKTKGADGKPIYATPGNDTLFELSQTFRPPRNSNFATGVRVGMGPGSWFKIDMLCELMRRTNMGMEDRMLFAEDVKKMEESKQAYTEENSNIRIRMKNILQDKTKYSASDARWIDSDGNGSIRIVDDFVGTFTYSTDTYKSVRHAAKDDIPTHLRLNHVYFDTIRGRVDDQTVLRLVPFYIVSLYRKQGDIFKRLRVRNRADRTFLPRQTKLSALFRVEDYKGYACSICLNQDEFDTLVAEQVTSDVDRRIIQIPGPFLFKYHKILYQDAKENMEDLLIEKKRDPSVSLETELVPVGDPDDMSAPFSDGMIRLGDDIRYMTAVSKVMNINGRYYNEDGTLASEPVSDLTVLDDKIYYKSVKVKELPYKVELFSIHSKTMAATYGNEDTSVRFVTKGNVYVFRLARGKWSQRYVATLPDCSILRWSKKILLVGSRDIVHGYDTSNAYVQTLTCRGHMDRITCIDVKNNQIVTGSRDNTLIVWENKEPVIAKTSRVLVKDSNGYRFGNVKDIDNGLACEVDLLKTPRNKIASGVFECTPSAHIKTLYGHTNAVEFVVWGKYIVSSSTDKSIIVWRKGSMLYRKQFNALHLVEPSKAMPYKRLVDRNADSQPHLLEAYSSGLAPFVALCTSEIIFYGIGSILGKINILTGKRILFQASVVNSVSELPSPVHVKPDRDFFNEDGTLALERVRPSPERSVNGARWLRNMRKRARKKKKKRRARKAAKLK